MENWKIVDDYFQLEIDHLIIKLKYSTMRRYELQIFDLYDDTLLLDEDYLSMIEVENEVSYYYRYSIDYPTFEQLYHMMY